MPRHPSAGPGKGPGWGGPAKGGGDTVLAPFQPANDAATHVRMDRAARKELRAARAEQLEDMLFDLAQNAERQETQVTAIVRLHAIYEGQPVARNVNMNVDDLGAMDASDISDELARLERAEAAAASGTVAPRLPRQDDPLVH